MKGFTLIELLITMGIIAILLGLIFQNLLTVQHKTALNTSVDSLVSNLKSQQIKAMVGEIDGGGAVATGVYFESDKYILFRGQTYSPSNSTNFSLALDRNLHFSSPGQRIIFSPVSGDRAGGDVISIIDTSGGEQKQIRLNRYGVITNVN